MARRASYAVYNRPRPRTTNGANLGFEEQPWQMAGKPRVNMDAAEYKDGVLVETVRRNATIDRPARASDHANPCRRSSPSSASTAPAGQAGSGHAHRPQTGRALQPRLGRLARPRARGTPPPNDGFDWYGGSVG